jgi:hypothetical protein
MVKLANGKRKQTNAKKSKSAPKKKPSKPGLPTGLRNEVLAYKAALTRPFSPSAGGARVTDLYSTPTVSRTIKRNFTIKSDAAGECDLIFLPHPGNPIFSPRGSIVNGTTWTYLDNATTTVTNGTVTSLMSTIASELANYRVVGCGIKITATCADTVSQGLTVTGTVPYRGPIPQLFAVGAQVDNAGVAVNLWTWLEDSGIPQNGTSVDLTQVPNLARAITATTQGLETSSLVASPRITSPEAFNWRRTKDSHLGFDIVDQTSATFVASGDASYLDASGFEAIVFGATGLPVSTNMFTVETIFHVEGSARLASSSLNAEQNKPSPVSWSGFVEAMTAAAQTPAVQLIASSAAASLKSSLMAMLL